MSTDPDVFDKLDSLINRHRLPGEAPPAPVVPPAGEIPMLTDEVKAEAMAVPVIPVLTETVEKPAPKGEKVPGGDEELPDWLTGGGTAPKPVPPSVPASTPKPVPPHPLTEMERLLVLAVERRLAPRLAGVLDVALGELLEQFRQEVDRMVKESVTEELLQHLEDFANRQKTPPSA